MSHVRQKFATRISKAETDWHLQYPMPSCSLFLCTNEPSVKYHKRNRRVRPHKSPSLIIDPKKMKICNEICFGKELVVLFHAQNDGINFPMCVLFWFRDYHFLNKGLSKIAIEKNDWSKGCLFVYPPFEILYIFVEMSWNFKTFLKRTHTHKPWALSTRSSKTPFERSTRSWHRNSGTWIQAINLEALPTWNPLYTVEPKVVKLWNTFKKKVESWPKVPHNLKSEFAKNNFSSMPKL